MTDKKVRRLKNLTVNEVSLVDRPAINRTFLLFKRQAPKMVDITDTLDEEEVNRQFNALSASEQERFLLALQGLVKRVAELPGADAAEEAVQVNYEFGAMSDNEKAHFLSRLNTAAEEVDKLLKQRGLTPEQKDALVDIWKTEIGMIRLQLRDPEAAAELDQAVEFGDAETLRKFSFEMDAQGIPIISKSCKGVLAENRTHEAVEDSMGRVVWKLKQGRDSAGRYR